MSPKGFSGGRKPGVQMGPGLVVPGRDKTAELHVRQATQVIGDYAEKCGGVERVHFADGRYMTFNPPVSLENLRAMLNPTIDVRVIDPSVQVAQLRRQEID